MDVTETLTAPCSPEVLFAWIEDLCSYPRWLNIVPRAEIKPIDDGDAWVIDLRGRLGPLARSKRLHMVRTVHEPPRAVTFERLEHDGREHSVWVLRAEVIPIDEGSQLTMRLHYGGSLWGPLLERLLGDEIGQSRERLLECVASGFPQ